MYWVPMFLNCLRNSINWMRVWILSSIVQFCGIQPYAKQRNKNMLWLYFKICFNYYQTWANSDHYLGVLISVFRAQSYFLATTTCQQWPQRAVIVQWHFWNTFLQSLSYLKMPPKFSPRHHFCCSVCQCIFLALSLLWEARYYFWVTFEHFRSKCNFWNS
jgi:hypothetical protein